MSHIFISYRRDDSAGWTGRLASDLKARFGRDVVFRDLDTLDGGDDFVGAIKAVLDKTEVALVVIGPQWLQIPDGQRAPRLDNPEDLLRTEIRTALQREAVRVIPILVGGVRMPDKQELPEDLQGLAGRSALEISDSRWEHDVQRLFNVLVKSPVLDAVATRRRRWIAARRALLVATGVAALALVALAVDWRERRKISQRMLSEFSLDRPADKALIPLGATQAWMLEGRLSASAAAQAPDISIEVFKLPERHAVRQDGRLRLSTETGFWRFESATFQGAGPYEIVATVTVNDRKDFRSVEVECLAKDAAYRRFIDADRERRGVAKVPAVPTDQQSVVRLKEQLYALQQQFFDAYIARSDLDAAYNVVADTMNALDPILPAFPDDHDLQNFRAYSFKNYAMVMRDRGNQSEFVRALDEAERMFAAIREQAPTDAGAWNGLGSVALLRGDPARALQHIDRALELKPAYPEAKADRREVLRMLGK